MDEIEKRYIKKIVSDVISGIDYRKTVQAKMSAEFLTYVVDFITGLLESKKRADAKGWYQSEYITKSGLLPEDAALHACINKKTIGNMYGSTRKDVMLNASITQYNLINHFIEPMLKESSVMSVHLGKDGDCSSTSLEYGELLIAIHSMAVKWAKMRGGAYSSVGKRVEGPLMTTLCRIFSVPETSYSSDIVGGHEMAAGNFAREVDFFLIGGDGKPKKCEVKLMGKGNPESMDAIFARESNVFVGDTLSSTNKAQCDANSIEWVALREPGGWQRFGRVLKNLGIPCKEPRLVDVSVLIDGLES
jgi:hypothetical protein